MFEVINPDVDVKLLIKRLKIAPKLKNLKLKNQWIITY